VVIQFATMLLFKIGQTTTVSARPFRPRHSSLSAPLHENRPQMWHWPCRRPRWSVTNAAGDNFSPPPPRRPPRGLGHAALDSDHAECEKEKIPHASMNRQACQVTYIELITSTFLPIHPPKITHLLPKIKITGATCAHCGRFLYMDICRDSHPGYLNSKTLFSGWDSATTPRRVLLPILKNNTIALRIKTTLIQNIQSGQPYLIQICKKVRVGQESTWLQILN